MIYPDSIKYPNTIWNQLQELEQKDLENNSLEIKFELGQLLRLVDKDNVKLDEVRQYSVSRNIEEDTPFVFKLEGEEQSKVPKEIIDNIKCAVKKLFADISQQIESQVKNNLKKRINWSIELNFLDDMMHKVFMECIIEDEFNIPQQDPISCRDRLYCFSAIPGRPRLTISSKNEEHIHQISRLMKEISQEFNIRFKSLNTKNPYK